jgi:hypothetical protein
VAYANEKVTASLLIGGALISAANVLTLNPTAGVQPGEPAVGETSVRPESPQP